MQLIIHQFNLQLKHTFAISRRAFDAQQNIVVELQADGHSGFGEATYNPYYPNTEINTMIERLESIRTDIEQYTFTNPSHFWKHFQGRLADCPFALCALDVAAHDWYGKTQGQPLYKLWGLEPEHLPITSYTLGIAKNEVLLKRMEELTWPVYKIKLGTDRDIEILQFLRQHTDANFRVDANCAWTVEETIQKSVAMKKLGVEFIEQPLPADDWEGMKAVFNESALPLYADESCRTQEDILRCKGHFHGVNIKLMKCGGLSPALDMIRLAKLHGLQVMVGCMTESTVGISAIAHLLPLLDHVDMDGPLFLKKDIASGVEIRPDGVRYAPANGTGAQLLQPSPA